MKIDLFGLTHVLHHVWRKPATVTTWPVPSLMLWGCFSAAGRLVRIKGKGIKNEYSNVQRILDDKLLQSSLDLILGRRFIFKQDNDPKYTSQITKEWLHSVNVQPEARLGPD